MKTPHNEQTRLAASLLVLLIVSTTLTGCVTGPPNPTPTPKVVGCPQLTPVDKATQGRIADAAAALPENSPLNFVIDDWIKGRDQTRACRKKGG